VTLTRFSKPIALLASPVKPDAGVSKAMTFASGFTSMANGVLIGYGSSNVDSLRFMSWEEFNSHWQ
jgi:hypothetical protein